MDMQIWRRRQEQSILFGCPNINCCDWWPWEIEFIAMTGQEEKKTRPITPERDSEERPSHVVYLDTRMLIRCESIQTFSTYFRSDINGIIDQAWIWRRCLRSRKREMWAILCREMVKIHGLDSLSPWKALHLHHTKDSTSLLQIEWESGRDLQACGSC